MSNQTFNSYSFSKPVLKAIAEMGYESPTPIQQQTFPILLGENTDFLGLAQTGTGKTAAFCLPLLEKIDPNIRKIQGIILSPTRELCQQICEQLESFTKYTDNINMVAVFGGASIRTQIDAIKKGVQIIVGTPGRFIDLLRRKVIKLEHLKLIILDEADEMLNMGFREDIDYILQHISQQKNTWLFSATMPKEIRNIINNYMRDPQEVRIQPDQKTNIDIDHQVSFVSRKNKPNALMRIIDVNLDIYGIVFCRTKKDTEELSKKLTKDGYKADYLNGDLSQAQRDNVMSRFKNGQLNILIATDVAARGIDVDNLTHVIHYSLPDQIEYYTHRAGRTGRAGNKGISLTLISTRDMRRLRSVESSLKIKINQYKIPLFKDVASIRIKHRLEKMLENENSNIELNDEMLAWLKSKIQNITKLDLAIKTITLDNVLSKSSEVIEDLNENDRSKKSNFSNNKRERFNNKGRRGKARLGDKNFRSRQNDVRKKNGIYSNDRSTTRSSNNMVNFSVDIGSNTLANKGHLIRLLCDETGLSKSHFGNIKILKKESHIEVLKEDAQLFKKMVNGKKVKGKKIRVYQ